MPRANFDPDTIDWRPFFIQPQIGGAYFKGKPYMQGTGIGALFKSFYRFILPLATSVGKEVGREGLSVGTRILGDISKGEEPKKALEAHTREGIRNLLGKAKDKLEQRGSGKTKKTKKRQQKGRGTVVQTYKTTIPKASASKKRKRSVSVRLGRLGGRSVSRYSPPNKKKKKQIKKIQRFDSLGPY